MDIKVFWTDTARFQLEDIFDYYKTKANLKTAKKIVDKSLTLEKNPKIG